MEKREHQQIQGSIREKGARDFHQYTSRIRNYRTHVESCTLPTIDQLKLFLIEVLFITNKPRWKERTRSRDARSGALYNSKQRKT